MTASPPSLAQLRISDPDADASASAKAGEGASAGTSGTAKANGTSSPTSTQSPTQPSTPSEPEPTPELEVQNASSNGAAAPIKAPVPVPIASRPAPKAPSPAPGGASPASSSPSNPTRPSAVSSATSPPAVSRAGGIGAASGPRQPLAGRAMGPMGMRGAGGQAMQSRVPPSLQAKMDAFAASRQGAPNSSASPSLGPNPNATSMGALLRSQALGAKGGAAPPSAGAAGGSGSAGGAGPSLPGPASGPLSLAARRAGTRPNLGSLGMAPSAPGGLNRPAGGIAGRRGPPGGLNLSSMQGGGAKEGSKFSDFKNIMDPSGSLRFSSKAVLTAKGIDFEDGASFQINMDEMEVIGELGKGNYGSVQQVYHRPNGVMMAMKEIRLELDESKLNGIIMELDILHRAVAPEIVEFYGAFTAESCVYYCMELMDAGSLDTLTGGGVPAAVADKLARNGDESATSDEARAARVPEAVLRRITAAMVRGLKFLKDELQIMHRDVKPTNVLINKKGEVKLCDFGVSGQLEKSLAKTNIGCQSYMAPERIKGESQNQVATYTVSSDVWSVGLSIIELAKGCYPFPPETFANVFAQLQAIVYGPAPVLPGGYSADANEFVAQCLLKDPNARPTYAQLLEHPFLVVDRDAEVDMAGWVAECLERRSKRGVKALAPVEA